MDFEDGYYYIGKTKRLCRRFKEHEGGHGVLILKYVLIQFKIIIEVKNI